MIAMMHSIAEQVITPRLHLREVVCRRGQQPISWLQETEPGWR